MLGGGLRAVFSIAKAERHRTFVACAVPWAVASHAVSAGRL